MSRCDPLCIFWPQRLPEVQDAGVLWHRLGHCDGANQARCFMYVHGVSSKL